jgi:hypothetical protein
MPQEVCGCTQAEKLKLKYDMQTLKYQTDTADERKAVVLTISQGLKVINEKKFPKISMSVKSGNNKKNQVLELLIKQMYSNNLDLEKSFLAVEDNI